MSSAMDRRHWIRSSALATAAWAIGRDRITAAEGAGGADGATIYLDQNENPYGISGMARKAIMDTVKLANRYPGDEMAELRDLIAAREGVPNDHVVLGAGSTEIFSLAGLLYGADGKEVLLAEPTYSGFKNYIDRIKGKLNSVPVDSRWEHDLDEMARRFTAKTSLVYICNPNNPTGTIVDSGKLRSFCESAARSAMVFVDEAYGDLVEDSRYSSMVDLVKKNANVMIARTFSKIHGLAGMRVGYGLARPEIIERVPPHPDQLRASQPAEHRGGKGESTRTRNSCRSAGNGTPRRGLRSTNCSTNSGTSPSSARRRTSSSSP